MYIKKIDFYLYFLSNQGSYKQTHIAQAQAQAKQTSTSEAEAEADKHKRKQSRSRQAHSEADTYILKWQTERRGETESFYATLYLEQYL